MIKYALLAGVMTIAAPALAQTQTSPAQTGAPTTQTAPTTAPAPTTAVPPADPSEATAAPQDGTTPAAQGAMAAPQTSASASDPAAQPAAADQVVAVVDKEFPTYDANKDGKLSKAEFATWMVALKKASDPTATATSAETKSWVGAAFTQADKDKNQSVQQGRTHRLPGAGQVVTAARKGEGRGRRIHQGPAALARSPGTPPIPRPLCLFPE